MIQNSLDVLFDGMLRTLQEVAPLVRDDYARGQLEAAADILANLAERVDWREAELRETIRRARAILAAAVAEAPDAAELAAARDCLAQPRPSTGGLTATRDLHLRALAGVQRYAGETDSAGLQRRLDRFLKWQLETETVLLRRARARARRTSPAHQAKGG